MGMEYELKYRATPEILKQLQVDFPGHYTTQQMRTTYYDTSSGDLSARRWTLRHRQENDKHICTFKCPTGGGARGEWEMECDDIEKAVVDLALDAEQIDLMRLAQRGLIPVCGARFTRVSALWVSKTGTAVELALDEGVLLGSGRELPFAELELELKRGSREDVQSLGDLLAVIYDLETEHASKFARAKLLAQEAHDGI